MNDYYEIEKNVNRILTGKSTNFLDGKMFNEVRKRLSKVSYEIYKPYIDSEKVIIYVNEYPTISLIQINSNESLRHQDIMGSLYNMGLESEMFGDIVIENKNYYFYIINSIKDYVFMNFNKVKSTKISLKEIDLKVLENYKRKYEEKTMIVSSERVDNIIAHIINTNREKIKDLIKDKDIILNYEVLNNHSKNLKKGDLFSIRKYGKYRYDGILKNTKKDNLLVQYSKYI